MKSKGSKMTLNLGKKGSKHSRKKSNELEASTLTNQITQLNKSHSQKVRFENAYKQYVGCAEIESPHGETTEASGVHVLGESHHGAHHSVHHGAHHVRRKTEDQIQLNPYAETRG